MVSRSELDGIVKKPVVALHGTRGKSTVYAAGEEQSSVKYRLYYCLMTRFILLILRAPFAAQRVSSGGGVYETRYGKWEEAWRDSHELVEAAAALHEHFEEFARAEGWISLATFSVTVSWLFGCTALSSTYTDLSSTPLTAPLLHLCPPLPLVSLD